MNDRTVRLLVAGLLAIGPAATPLAGQAGGTVDTNGASIAYRDIGDGEPIVLLHGFGESGAIWDPVVDDLSRHFRLVIPDMRGHGDSSNPLPYFTHADAGRDVVGLLDALGIERTRALGFSSGGMVLLHVATDRPDLLTEMAIVASGPYLPESARQIMRGMEADAMPMSQLETMGLVHGDTAQARHLLRQFVDFEDSYRDMSFTPPLLSTIEARTLVVYGDRDPFFPVELGVDLFRSIPDAELLVIPGLQHRPFPPEPEGRAFFAHTLLRFFGAYADDREPGGANRPAV